jgi:hypothetical protein
VIRIPFGSFTPVADNAVGERVFDATANNEGLLKNQSFFHLSSLPGKAGIGYSLIENKFPTLLMNQELVIGS